MTVTIDLSKFRNRELSMAADLLNAVADKGYPDDFNEDNVKLMFNLNSGFVFLTNDDCQVCLMNGDTLESFYTCPYCGHEGFQEDMSHDPEDSDCVEYMESIGVEVPS